MRNVDPSSLRGLFFFIMAVSLPGAVSVGYGIELMGSGQACLTATDCLSAPRAVEVGKRFFLAGTLLFTLSPLLICLADD